jgi:hypothetical protein
MVPPRNLGGYGIFLIGPARVFLCIFNNLHPLFYYPYAAVSRKFATVRWHGERIKTCLTGLKDRMRQNAVRSADYQSATQQAASLRHGNQMGLTRVRWGYG